LHNVSTLCWNWTNDFMRDCSMQAIELVSFSQNGLSKVDTIVLVCLRVIQNGDGDTRVRIINHYF
jgi:hypothetical protein